MKKFLYLLGLLGPLVFLASVVVGGASVAGYSHLADAVSELGMTGGPEAAWVNAAWAVSGGLIAALGLALWLDRTGPGRGVATAVFVAGLGSAAIALWFPMDPPGTAPASAAQLGHNVLVAVCGLAFAAALVLAARAQHMPLTYRRLCWLGLAAMLAGGVGAALSGALGWGLVGLFERLTQTGYHGWIVVTAWAGLCRRDRGDHHANFS